MDVDKKRILKKWLLRLVLLLLFYYTRVFVWTRPMVPWEMTDYNECHFGRFTMYHHSSYHNFLLIEEDEEESLPRVLYTGNAQMSDGVHIAIGSDLVDWYKAWNTPTWMVADDIPVSADEIVIVRDISATPLKLNCKSDVVYDPDRNLMIQRMPYSFTTVIEIIKLLDLPPSGRQEPPKRSKKE